MCASIVLMLTDGHLRRQKQLKETSTITSPTPSLSPPSLHTTGTAPVSTNERLIIKGDIPGHQRLITKEDVPGHKRLIINEDSPGRQTAASSVSERSPLTVQRSLVAYDSDSSSEGGGVASDGDGRDIGDGTESPQHLEVPEVIRSEYSSSSSHLWRSVI